MASSPILPSDIADTIPESTGSICTKLEALWSLANKMFTWFDWWENDDGTLSNEAMDFLAPASVPVGSLVFYPLDIAPDGWLVANGAIVSRTTYDSLFAAYGVKYGAGDGVTTFGLPDMRRRFPFGTSGSNVSGTLGGDESATLEISNLPAHTHGLNEDVISAVFGNPVLTAGNSTPTVGGNFTGLDDSDGDLLDTVGGDEPVSILPPYMSGHWIIKT